MLNGHSLSAEPPRRNTDARSRCGSVRETEHQRTVEAARVAPTLNHAMGPTRLRRNRCALAVRAVLLALDGTTTGDDEVIAGALPTEWSAND